MMTEAQSTFSLLVEKLYQALADDAARKMRAKAWNRLQETGLPSQDAAFRYVPLRKFYSQNYVKAETAPVNADEASAHIYPECRESFLVFVNGFFAPELSRPPKRVIVSGLEEAATSYGALLNNQWAKALKEERDPFALINASVYEQGAFVYLPPRTILDGPIQILHILASDGRPMFMVPRLQVFIGAHSEAELITSHVRLRGAEGCVNSVIDLAIEEDAHVRCTQALTQDPESVWHFEALRATLKRNSTLNLISLTEGSASVRKDYHVILSGENSEANLNGLSRLDGKRESHTQVLIDHQAPHCRSRQLFKNVLDDAGRSSFEGKILVRQAAQKTDAFQLNNNLLLSDRAAADSKPNLEIFADDVKASHGATFGQLDPEQLFMLKSRGIDASQAQNLLVRGFYKEIVDLIRLPSLLKHSLQRLGG